MVSKELKKTELKKLKNKSVFVYPAPSLERDTETHFSLDLTSLLQEVTIRPINEMDYFNVNYKIESKLLGPL